MNPEHLFDQAEKLIQAPAAGRPRQVDLRRGVSAAYYGLFHATLAAAADLVVGTTNRSTAPYELVHRSIDHRALKELCTEVTKQTLPRKYATYIPPTGFWPNIATFATAFSNYRSRDTKPIIILWSASLHRMPPQLSGLRERHLYGSTAPA